MATENPEHPRPARHWIHWMSRGHKICAALLAVGVLLQLTIRDRLPFPVAALYYGLPRPLLVVLAVAAAVSARPPGRWRFLAAAAVLAGWTAYRDFAWNPPRDSGGAAETVVFWNVGHDLMDDVAVVDGFLETSPLVVGLVETGDLEPQWLDAWRTRHPDYTFVQTQHTILMAVRAPVTDQGYSELGRNSHAAWADFSINGTAFRAVVVDIAANPWISRREPLTQLQQMLDSWRDRQVILMGDFNTPDDSVWFTGIQKNYRETFRAAGSGYVPTWPWPAPVLKLDQIWVPKTMRVRRSWQTYTWRSDHRALWAELSL